MKAKLLPFYSILDENVRKSLDEVMESVRRPRLTVSELMTISTALKLMVLSDEVTDGTYSESELIGLSFRLDEIINLEFKHQDLELDWDEPSEKEYAELINDVNNFIENQFED